MCVRKHRNIFIMTLTMVFICFGMANAETVSEADAEASITNYVTGETRYCAELETALAAIDARDTVMVLKDAVVEKDFLPDVACILESENHAVISVKGDDEAVRVSLADELYLRNLTIKTEDAAQKLILETAGNKITLEDMELHGTLHCDDGDDVIIKEDDYFYPVIWNITGYGDITIETMKIYLNSLECSSIRTVGTNSVHICCQAETRPEALLMIHNKPGQAPEELFLNFLGISYDCTRETAGLLAGGSADSDGITVLAFDYPIDLDDMLYRFTINGLNWEAKQHEKEEFILFGYSDSELHPVKYDSYRAVYAKPYSLKCKLAEDMRKMYKPGDKPSLMGVTATVTYENNGRYYSKSEDAYPAAVPSGYAFGLLRIEPNLELKGTIPFNEPFLELIWKPVPGVAITERLFAVTDYCYFYTENSKMLPDGRCTVEFDLQATRDAGTAFELDEFDSLSRIRTDVNGTLVFRIKPDDGYKIKEIAPVNCRIERMSGDCYKIFNFSGRSSITVKTEKVPLVTGGTEAGDNEEKAPSDLKPAVPSKNEKLIAGVQKTTVKLYKPAIVKSSKSKSGKAIKLRWKKSAGYKVDSYQLVRTMKKSDSYKKTYTVNSNRTAYTNYAGLKNKNTYYYKIRGVRSIDGKRYYTQWSSKRSIVFRT